MKAVGSLTVSANGSVVCTRPYEDGCEAGRQEHRELGYYLLASSFISIHVSFRQVQFTLADQEALLDYLYKRTPLPEEGGRSAQNLWKEFVNPRFVRYFLRVGVGH